MEFLLNPNIAYLLLAIGVIFALLSLISPGSGILEIIALFTLLPAAYAVVTLGFNTWALVVLLLGAVLFLFSVRRAGEKLFLIISIVALVIGSSFLFRGEQWWQPAVHPVLALVVSILMAGFFWIAVRKFLEAVKARPAHDLAPLIGALGEARTDIHQEGSVQVGSELWSARSLQPVPKGARVRVLAREGFLLTVEEVTD